MAGRRTFASDEEREAFELDTLDAHTTTLASLASGAGLTYGAVGDISQIDSGDAAAAGAVGKPSDAGHQHALPTPAAPTVSAVADAAAAGASAKLAREDHRHGREAFGTAAAQADYGTAVNGTATTVSRSDHLHGTPPRRGCRLRRAANQSINSGAPTAISWDTEDQDTDGFIAVTATTVTVPTGLDGVYTITLQAIGAVTNRAYAEVAVTSGITGVPTAFRLPLDQTEDRVTVTASTPLAAGDTLVCNVFHLTGSAVNFTAWLSCYRMAA